MEDGPPGPLGASQRLAALQSYHQAWRKLQWQDKFSVPMAGGHAWELLGCVAVISSVATTRHNEDISPETPSPNYETTNRPSYLIKSRL